MKLRRFPSDPQRAHPLVKRIFSEMREKKVTYLELEMRSGVDSETMRRWRKGQAPMLGNVEACLNALGLRLDVRAA